MCDSARCEDPTVIPTPIPNDNSTESRLIAELGIIRGGRHYFYDGYSYDRLSDAIAYARLVRGQAHRTGLSSPAELQSSESPDKE